MLIDIGSGSGIFETTFAPQNSNNGAVTLGLRGTLSVPTPMDVCTNLQALVLTMLLQDILSFRVTGALSFQRFL